MKKQAGFSLLEMLIVCLVLETLMVMALPNAAAIQKLSQRQTALSQVQRVRNAENTLAICSAQNLSCPGVAPQVPQVGSLTTGGYVFVFNQDSGVWSYSAVPLAGGRSYWADQTGLIRFADSGAAGPASTLLQ